MYIIKCGSMYVSDADYTKALNGSVEYIRCVVLSKQYENPPYIFNSHKAACDIANHINGEVFSVELTEMGKNND